MDGLFGSFKTIINIGKEIIVLILCSYLVCMYSFGWSQVEIDSFFYIKEIAQHYLPPFLNSNEPNFMLKQEVKKQCTAS